MKLYHCTFTVNLYFQRQLNQQRFVRWNYETMDWDPSLCEGQPPERMFQCQQLESYAILFVSDRVCDKDIF